ncbi:hypothetical protein FHG87_016629 [Trinorchestia longiramus]|nr:hypothetical protein FHG87_016629 [Trinorchestia longiramus]
MGVGVMQTKNEVLLEQSAYTKAMLSRFGMDKANSVATPVDINADPFTTSDEVEECDRLIPKCCWSSMMRAEMKIVMKVVVKKKAESRTTRCLEEKVELNFHIFTNINKHKHYP